MPASGSRRQPRRKFAARLAAQFPEITIDGLTPSPIDGLYEVRLGAQLAYVTADGQYLFQGDIFEVATRANLTEERRNLARAEAVERPR